MKYRIVFIVLLSYLGIVLTAQEIRHIDLGLTVEWGDCNIGANNPYDHGLYFAWGETASFGKMDTTNINNYRYSGSFYRYRYDYETYKWYSGNDSISPVIPYFPYFSKYSTDGSKIITHRNQSYDDLTTLEDKDDAANLALGGYWRMPTQAEMQELVEKCTWIWTQLNDISGYLVVSKINDNSIFLPVTGFRFLDRIENDVCGYYWSKSLSTTGLAAETLLINESYYQIIGTGRFMGNAIRPVWDPK